MPAGIGLRFLVSSVRVTLYTKIRYSTCLLVVTLGMRTGPLPPLLHSPPHSSLTRRDLCAGTFSEHFFGRTRMPLRTRLSLLGTLPPAWPVAIPVVRYRCCAQESNNCYYWTDIFESNPGNNYIYNIIFHNMFLVMKYTLSTIR